MADSSARARSRTLSREDWVLAAIDEVVRGGSDALRIDRLCTALDVTKGSFYHHFESRDALVDAIAEYWARTQPERVVQLLEELRDAPVARLKLLIRLFTDMEIGTRDHAIRALGTNEPRIAAAVDAADKLVLSTLEGILRSIGLTTEDARAFARMMMFATIGFYTAPNLGGKNAPREVGKRILELVMETANARP